MNREERERMVDRLLNEALAPHEVEPRAGLEQRILANLRAQPEPRPWWRWMWAPAAVAAVVLLVIVLRPTRPSQPATPPVSVDRRQAPAVTTKAAPPLVATRRKLVRRKPVPRTTVLAKTEPAGPRQPIFAPARLSEAERALLAMLQSKPDEAQALVQQQEQTRQEAAEFMEQAMAARQ